MYLWDPEHHNRLHKCLLNSFLSQFHFLFYQSSINIILPSLRFLSQVVLPRGLTTTKCVFVPRASYTCWPLYPYRFNYLDYVRWRLHITKFILAYVFSTVQVTSSINVQMFSFFFLEHPKSWIFLWGCQTHPTLLKQSWERNSSCDLLSFYPLQADYRIF